jgi:nucleoid-associated protein YgaU
MAAALTTPPVAAVSGRRTPSSPRRAGPVTPDSRPAPVARAADGVHAWPCTPAAVYRRRRLVAALVAAELLVGAILLVAAAITAVVTSTASPAVSSPVVAGPARAEPEVIVVREGDTLWSIARELDPDGDPRVLVSRLAERSGGAGLRPGQRLRVDGLR